MKVMALDLSLNGTGIAICNAGGSNLKTHLVKTNKCKDHMNKIIKIRGQIFKRIRIHNIKKVYIEGQSYASRGRATLSIAQLHGVIMYCLMLKDISFECIPPTTVKKYISGKGNCKKSLILKSLLNIIV